jgi:hypothetical protein
MALVMERAWSIQRKEWFKSWKGMAYSEKGMFSARKVHVLVRGGHGFSKGSAWW